MTPTSRSGHKSSHPSKNQFLAWSHRPTASMPQNHLCIVYAAGSRTLIYEWERIFYVQHLALRFVLACSYGLSFSIPQSIDQKAIDPWAPVSYISCIERQLGLFISM